MNLGYNPFIGQISIVPFNFKPRDWASCNGQELSVSQNTALFSILGTRYGGDGRRTFGLPDLQGRVAIHPGQGQGLSIRQQGELGGAESVALSTSEIPNHSHNVTTQLPAGEEADTDNPVNAYPGISTQNLYSTTQSSNLGPFKANLKTQSTGENAPHNNMQPSLVLHYIIALVGIFPSRS